MVYYSAAYRGAWSIVMSMSVCVCVCLSAIISPELHFRSLSILLRLLPGCGSVLLWRRSDTLLISGL